ncbi:MAG: hypothetical protein JKX92_12315 [Porticoccaceae bacterium]|nr:hypothetical protein [Porticoccaceae bacterium]
MSMNDIESLATKHANNVDKLAELARTVNEEIEACTHRASKRLQSLAAKCVGSEQLLEEAIEDHPELFEKPRTLVLRGLKLGYAKGRDKLEFEEEKTIELIDRHFPELAQALIKTVRKSVTTALGNLQPAQLKKIKVDVVEGDDTVVLKVADTATNKLVSGYIAAGKKA